MKDFYKLIVDLKLKPSVLDIVGNCISKYLTYNWEFGLVATIGIGYYKTNLIISKYGQMRYTKILHIGYKTIEEDLKDLNIDRRELMSILNNETDLYNPSEKKKRILESNNKFQKELLKGVDIILKYYLEDETMETIYLYEEYSKTSNIENIFTDHFNIKCKRLNTLNNLQFSGDISSFANTIGGLIRA